MVFQYFPVLLSLHTREGTAPLSLFLSAGLKLHPTLDRHNPLPVRNPILLQFRFFQYKGPAFFQMPHHFYSETHFVLKSSAQTHLLFPGYKGSVLLPFQKVFGSLPVLLEMSYQNHCGSYRRSSDRCLNHRSPLRLLRLFLSFYWKRLHL